MTVIKVLEVQVLAGKIPVRINPGVQSNVVSKVKRILKVITNLVQKIFRNLRTGFLYANPVFFSNKIIDRDNNGSNKGSNANLRIT